MATSIAFDSTEGSLFEGFEPYQLSGVSVTDEELGTGAYASVLKLDYMGLKCAGKKIHSALLQQGSTISYTVRRFRDECQLLSRVRHPNIVQFLGVHFQAGVQVPMLVMEFLPFNLCQCLSEHTLQTEIAYSILHDVAMGLNYLHSQLCPIVHRDLSSNNVLLMSNMTAKISDLGVARIIDLSPQTAQLTQTPGTPAFMPPEVMVARPTYNTSVDVFSYGIMMIHILSGVWPEPQIGPTLTEGGTLIPVSEAERRVNILQVIGYNHPLMELIHKCIHNNPQVRVSASEIVKQLADLVEQFPATFANQLDMIDYIRKLEKSNRALVEENMDMRSYQNMLVGRERKIISRLEKKLDNNYREMRGLIEALKSSHTKRAGKGRRHEERSASFDMEEEKQKSEVEKSHQNFNALLPHTAAGYTPLETSNKGFCELNTLPKRRTGSESDKSKYTKQATDTKHPLLRHTCSLKRVKQKGGKKTGVYFETDPPEMSTTAETDREQQDVDSRGSDDVLMHGSEYAEVNKQSPVSPTCKSLRIVSDTNSSAAILPSMNKRKINVRVQSKMCDEERAGLKHESYSVMPTAQSNLTVASCALDTSHQHHCHHQEPILATKKVS